ncbi:helix-turn-helix domain-containing protein [Clostridium pasteurianum]|uniref:Resolvase family protein n=1 Tax=Clostridium pasteurianum BC1 TaxID=86416 RepID=R4KEZ3_CLOPA|nr:helix-turn-helix domain-containing protein [Clostridium pasteurianum]AGK98180.1 resolvase family protein [Clostridium pasteurianum BC1]
MLTKDQEELVTLLIQGEKITDIAKKLNKARSTIYEWMKLDDINNELDRRKQELAHQGNNYIMRDLYTYIDNIKELADDKSDKRVCLAANQYLINRIYGNPTAVIDTNSDDVNENVNENELELELKRFKQIRKVK